MSNEEPFYSTFEQIPDRANRSMLESPIEEWFIETFEKYISPQARIYPQYEVITASGNFRIDFLIQLGDKKIAIECDGKDFHDNYRDEWRDAVILGYEKVDTIYRFRGKDLYWNANDCVHIIFHYNEEFFSSRYKYNFPRLISDDLKEMFPLGSIDGENNYIDYKIMSESGYQTGTYSSIIYRRDKEDKRAFWNTLFKFAKDNPGLSIEELIKVKSSLNTSS